MLTPSRHSHPPTGRGLLPSNMADPVDSKHSYASYEFQHSEFFYEGKRPKIEPGLSSAYETNEATRKLFVGGRLNRPVTIDHHPEVRSLVARYGGVLTRHGPTFTFFTFATPTDAEAALALDKHVLADGTSLRVAFAQPDPPPHKVLYLRYLSDDVMASDLRAEFTKIGPLDHLDHLPKRQMAFVEYVNLEDAIRARDYFFDKYHISFYVKNWRENKERERDQVMRDRDDTVMDPREPRDRERMYRWDSAARDGELLNRERERAERDMFERDRMERDRMERERMERERMERMERDRLERAERERERIDRERLERERLDREMIARYERDRERKRARELELWHREREREREKERELRAHAERGRERLRLEAAVVPPTDFRKREHTSSRRDPHDKKRRRSSHPSPRASLEREKEKDRETERDKERKRDRKRDSRESSPEREANVNTTADSDARSSASATSSPSPRSSRSGTPTRSPSPSRPGSPAREDEKGDVTEGAGKVDESEEVAQTNGIEEHANTDKADTGEVDAQRQLHDLTERLQVVMDARDEDKILIITLQKQIRGLEAQVNKLRMEVDHLRKEAK